MENPKSKSQFWKQYANKIGVIKEKLKKLEFIYILREKNARVNLLSKLSNIEEQVEVENVVQQTIHISRFFMIIESQES